MALGEIALSLVAAGLLTVTLAAAGARVRSLFRLPVAPLLRLPVDTVLGWWCLTSALLVLGLAHGLSRATVLVVVIVLAGAGRWRRTGWRWWPLVPPAATASLLLPVALAPPFFYDALVYHLALPWQALLEGGYLAHPENVFTAVPPLAQMLFLPIGAVGLWRAAAIVHLASWVLVGAALAGLSRARGAPRWAAHLGAAVVLPLPMYVLVPGVPAAEGFAVLGLLTALAAALAARHRGAPWLAGALAGVAIAGKLQIAPALVGVFLAVVVMNRPRLRSGLWFALAGAVGSVSWWGRNALLLGRPLLPLGWHGEGLAAWDRDLVQVLLIGQPLSALRTIWSNLAPHIGYLLPLLLAGVLAATAWRRRRVWLLALAAIGGFAGWLFTGIIPRFLAPGVVLAIALVATAAGRRRSGQWAAGLTLATSLLFGIEATVIHVRRIGGLRLITSDPSTVEASAIVNNPMPALRGATALPKSARVLFVGEPRPFLFPRQFVAASYYDSCPLRAPIERAANSEAVLGWLRDQGFSHLLVNWGELDRLARDGYPVAPWRTPAGYRAWQELIHRLGPPVIASGTVSIYAMPGTPADAGRGT